MTFLPIIERELRVRARSGGTYWVRFTIPLAGMLFCLPQLLWAGPFGTSATLGPGLLNGLVSAAFLLSCGACLLTADVISSERREGTLGLLLLTRVSTFDVLLGKLGSGLWASARGREWLKTARTALLLVAALVVGPSLVGLLFVPVGAVIAGIRLLSPLRTLSVAGDAMYKASPGEYWTSLILVQAMSWALVFGAGLRLRSGWREERGELMAPALATVDAPEPEAALPSRAPLGDAANPIAWLLQRQVGIQALIWAGALVGFIQFGVYSVMPRFLGSSSYLSMVWPLSRAARTLEGVLFAWAESRL